MTLCECSATIITYTAYEGGYTDYPTAGIFRESVKIKIENFSRLRHSVFAQNFGEKTFKFTDSHKT